MTVSRIQLPELMPYMRVESLVEFLNSCDVFFIGVLLFPPSTKTTMIFIYLKLNLIQKQWRNSHSMDIPLQIPFFYILFNPSHANILEVLLIKSRSPKMKYVFQPIHQSSVLVCSCSTFVVLLHQVKSVFKPSGWPGWDARPSKDYPPAL